MFETRHWSELTHQGYTVVSDAIEPRLLREAQDAASALAALHPEGDWERSRDESWREIRHCRHPRLAIVHGVLDPLTAEILDSAAARAGAARRDHAGLRRAPASAAPSMSTAAAERRSACSTCCWAWR